MSLEGCTVWKQIWLTVAVFLVIQVIVELRQDVKLTSVTQDQKDLDYH